MTEQFDYDVFLSHSSKDKDVVRPLADRLRKDGLKVWFDEWKIRPGDSIPAKSEEGLEKSRVLVLCMSANAFGSDWAQLESGTFRFRDPLNKERRFIPLRLDDASIKGSLAQFQYINWPSVSGGREQEYVKLLEVCFPAKSVISEETAWRDRFLEKIISLGHTARVYSVAWSPDRKQAVTGSEDKTVRLWEVSSGRCLLVLEGHTSSVYSVAWDPNGKHVLSGSADKSVRLWEVSRGHCLLLLEGHTSSVYSVAWSPDGKHVLSGSADKAVRLWEVSSGRCLHVFESHVNSVRSVAWSPDGKQALSGSTDNTVRLWEVSSGRCLLVLEGHTNSILSVAWRLDGAQVLTGSEDNTVRLWEVSSGRCLLVLEGHTNSILSVAWSPDGKQALSGSADRSVRLWEVSSGRCLRVLEGHTGIVWGIAWSPDGKQALSCSEDKTVRLWEVSSGCCLRVLEGHTGVVSSLVLSSDGKCALSGADDNSVRMWDMDTGKCLRVFKGHTNSVRSVAWSPDGKFAVSGGEDGTVRLWDSGTEKCQRVFKVEGSISSILSVVWHPGGQCFLSGSNRGTVRLWDVDKGQCQWVSIIKGATYSVRSLALSADGKYFLSGAGDNSVRVWDFETGECKCKLEGHTDAIWSVALSLDGKRALSGSGDNSVRVWDMDTGKCLRVLEGHAGVVRSLALCSDGKRALSGGDDKTVRLWEVESGKCLLELEGHSAGIRSVALSPDGKRAFSSAVNGVVRVWDLSALFIETRGSKAAAHAAPPEPDQVQYTNAKVLLVGDSGVGKTGLSNYLARGIKVADDKPLSSTDGAWATHWPVQHDKQKSGVEREIWLWDFAGQVDYRLVHQLYMDDTAVAVLVFNPQSENPFEGLWHWDRDLHRATRKPFAKLLVAARVDRGGLVVSATSIKKFMKERGFVGLLHETSAKTGKGCDQFRDAIVQAIDWQSIPEITSPVLFHRLKQEILSLRDSGMVLIRLAELKQRMEMTLQKENFELAELAAVVGLLSGPGIIKQLDFGGFILLRPEVLSRYAAAVVRKVRKHTQELGCIREDELLAGDLDYQDFQRLPREDEEVVLRTLLETFVSRAWCLRQPCDGTAMLTFPSYFRRERKEQPGHPSILVVYRFEGPTDEIYATLVVQLHHTVAFQTTELWRSAADFKTQTGQKLGFTLMRESEGASRLEVYFEPDVDENSKVLFLRYVHDHLMQHAQNVVRLRRFACGNKKCDSHEKQFIDQAMIDKALAPAGKGKVFCPDCGKPILLRDLIEKKFESSKVKEQSCEMDAEVQILLDNESRELILVGHAFTIVAEAGQIYRGYTNNDHGIDGEIEFKDDQGRASGKRFYLQLKSGDSYLKKRERDGAEIFQIKNQRWVDYWQKQSYPVMLVVRTSDGEIRWMDVSAYLKRESVGGKKVKQITFEGERFDVMSVRRWRDKMLGQADRT